VASTTEQINGTKPPARNGRADRGTTGRGTAGRNGATRNAADRPADPTELDAGPVEAAVPAIEVPAPAVDADAAAHRTADPLPDDRYLNRELSWLDFNERVIAIAEDPSAPLLERVKFLSIFSANLDQFFQIRVSGLRELAVNGSGGTSPDGLSAYEQLAAIRARVRDLVERVDRLYRDEIEPPLGDAGIAIVSTESLEPGEADHVERWFDDRVLPVLTPLAVDPSHPFPYISDLSLNLAVVVMDPETHVRRFARVKVPPLLPRFLALPGGRRFLPIEDAIGAHLDEPSPGWR
jgi:polyphosphate kinase